MVYVRKADGERELFDPSKLELSLTRAGASKESVAVITDHIVKTLKEDMSTSEIYALAFHELRRREHHVAAARYSLRRALFGLGPTGFPFEKYVGEIFKAEGYEVETDKILRGGCVEHEVDMVAYDAKNLAIAEIKFHNEPGYKTDLKVALYVHARIEDLSAKTFFMGGKERAVTQGWLITNTKFSQTAVDYATCKNIRLLGWNYPAEGNLEDLVTRYQLHPLSCLSSLSGQAMNALFAKGFVLCRDLVENPAILNDMPLTAREREQTLMEARRVCSDRL